MVVTVRWMESWTVVVICIASLLLIILILLSCVCWNKHKAKFRKFAVLDQKGVKRVFSPEISVINTQKGDKRQHGMFKQLSRSNTKGGWKFLKSPEENSDLRQSMEINHAFDHAVLQIERRDKDEDVLSCISNDSKQTFYSTYPMVRTMSTTGTIKSSASNPDLAHLK
ncbi:hypothetical protein PPYR_13527 [Photinus pyralis]|nr:uncharacterized protein LOC116178273 [Photinus pyralis]KAB0793907.1 hypothetical protein PPYR_13527 [Photinus pyralis]